MWPWLTMWQVFSYLIERSFTHPLEFVLHENLLEGHIGTRRAAATFPYIPESNEGRGSRAKHTGAYEVAARGE